MHTIMKKIIKMRQMLNNQAGTIKKISAQGEMGRRIREMGLVPKARVQIQGRAPLRDPVAVKIRDYILTLRNNEADSILVEIEEKDTE
jgi:ferrous iron transport protein A